MPGQSTFWWATERPSLMIDVSGIAAEYCNSTGTAAYIHVRCFDIEKDVSNAAVLIDNQQFPLPFSSIRPEVYHPFLQDEKAVKTGYLAGVVTLRPTTQKQRLKLELQVDFSDGSQCRVRGPGITVTPQDPVSAEPLGRPAGEDLVAVCMTVMRPDRKLFHAQIQSILEQTHENIVVLVNDDDPDSDLYKQEPLLRHAKVRYQRNSSQLGFYHNFERVLSRVPKQAAYVALADHDDFWYPEKLRSSLEALQQADLVFCGMTIKDRDGNVVAKAPPVPPAAYRHLDSLMTRNVVTGAACLFRRSLLDVALPFPQIVAAMYHDQWIACCAALRGGIRHLDQPLYDYIQHGQNVVGFRDTKWPSLRRTAGRLYSLGIRALFLRRYRDEVLNVIWGMVAVYHSWMIQLALNTAVLKTRLPDRAAALADCEQMFAGGYASLRPLLQARGRFRTQGIDTANIDDYLIQSLLADYFWWKILPRIRSGLQRLRRLNPIRAIR